MATKTHSEVDDADKTEDRKMHHGRLQAAWPLRQLNLQAIARERAILLARFWTALMLKRAIRLVESRSERGCRHFNQKAEFVAVLRCLHAWMLDGPPLADGIARTS